MNQAYFGSEHAPFEVDMQLSIRLGKYKLDPRIDDADRLRAYFVIMDLEEKVNDKSPWVVGFLICASIWSLQANGWPFSWTSTIFEIFDWSRSTMGILNLVLLVVFWTSIFLLIDNHRQKEMAPWQVSDEELNDLAERIRALRRRVQEKRNS